MTAQEEKYLNTFYIDLPLTKIDADEVIVHKLERAMIKDGSIEVWYFRKRTKTNIKIRGAGCN